MSLQANIKNRTIFCRDNLKVLQGIDSNCIDLIYIDPPFNKKKIFTAPIGSSAEGAEFRDIFREEDIKDEWIETIKQDQENVYSYLAGIKNYSNKYNYCYLCYMAIRLIEMHRILKSTGSMYLHCDTTMSHYLKLLLDCIFGEQEFRNEIIWNTNSPRRSSPKKFLGQYETILFYCKNTTHWNIANRDIERLVPFAESKFNQDQNGRHFYHLPVGTYSQEKIKQFRKENRIYETKNGKIRVKYFVRKIKEGFIRSSKITDVWNDIKSLGLLSMSAEIQGYPTQKPLKLLERIIEASSNKGDLVLDAFCGCATTCIAAEKLRRQWIGIDISVKAYELVKERLKKEVADPEKLLEYDKKINFQTQAPQRSDTKEYDRVQKYVYIISNRKYQNEYKVGIAKNCESRLNSYQINDLNRAYRLEYKKLTPHYREIEIHIHNKFLNKHEWVQGKLDNIRREISKYKAQ